MQVWHLRIVDLVTSDSETFTVTETFSYRLLKEKIQWRFGRKLGEIHLADKHITDDETLQSILKPGIEYIYGFVRFEMDE